TMLPDTPDVEAVLFGRSGVATALASGALAIDMSTIDPIATRGFHARLAERGVGFLDAPVSGGDVGARDATLSVMVGGSDADAAHATPLLRAMGRTIVHVGGPGAGQVAKLCNQVVIGGTLAAVSEALVLAAKAGVAPAKVREALLGGFAASKVLEVHGRRMLERDFAPGFFARLMRKDARIAVRAARELDVALPTFEVVARDLERLVEEHGETVDYSAFVRLREEDGGATVGGTPG
ncbi:MAG: NAD(P)-dependent oxidoreductase, partial [Actinomycetota bacterium]